MNRNRSTQSITLLPTGTAEQCSALEFGSLPRRSFLRGLHITQPRVASRELPLRLPRKTVMAHGSRIPREHYDFHHVAETGVASPQTLKTWNPVTLAIEVSAQFSDNGHCFAECALVRVFFLASSPSTSHSMGLNSTSHGSSGTSRPKRANNMIRQAITASMVMARSNTSAL